ncbi:MAG: hypothetical protein ACWA5P_01835 [bacterium]
MNTESLARGIELDNQILALQGELDELEECFVKHGRERGGKILFAEEYYFDLDASLTVFIYEKMKSQLEEKQEKLKAEFEAL